MARTPKNVEDRREHIIEAAIRVFAEKGFTRATNRDIAQAAGITTGLIYYYFKNKEDLLKAVLESRSPIQAIAEVNPEMLQFPPKTFLSMMFLRILEIVENEPFVNIIRVLFSEMLHGSSEVSPIAWEFFGQGIEFLSGYLRLQIAKGTIRSDIDVEKTTQYIISSLMGTVVRRQILHDPSIVKYTHEEIIGMIMNVVLQGIEPH